MKKLLFKILRIFTVLLGAIFFVFLIIAFTSLPFWMRYHLGTNVPTLSGDPDYIIMLGGGGIPEGKSLVRLFYTAEMAKEYPDATVIVSLPGDTLDNNSSISLMKQELIIRGVKTDRIRMECVGNNTRNEVVAIKKMVPDSSYRLLIITSPEHLYRSVKCFQKVGFINIGGYAAFERTLEADLLMGNETIGTGEAIPEIGDNIQLRYRFWNHLQFEVIVFREYVAIAYYWLKGWI
ncbi:MAG: YdcF family protein [Bacteroidales bacterium]|nr:YdcF family protein [Bacteroidales bacterium]